MKLAKVNNVTNKIENVIEVDQNNIPDWAQGWPEVTDAGKGWTWDGNKFVAPAPPPVSTDQVNRERLRRLKVGTDVSVQGNQQNIRVTGREEDRDNLNGLATASILRQQAGQSKGFKFRDGNNVVHDLNPAQMLELYSKALEYTEAVYQASWALKEMEEIPKDYKEDKYWP